MASARSSQEVWRGMEHHRSRSRRLSDQRRPAKAAIRDPCPGAYCAGAVVGVFSRSAGYWVDGLITKLEEGGFVRVEYQFDTEWYGKSLHMDSDYLIIPKANPGLSEEEYRSRVPVHQRVSHDEEHDPLPQCPPFWTPLSSDLVFNAKSFNISSSIADGLWDKGFTVRQLLHFYEIKRIGNDMSTEDVVREVIIPETAEEKTCYMESAFMKKLGGPKRSTTLVSHALKCPFMNTVLNILLDASGLPNMYLLQKCCDRFGKLIAEKALRELSYDALESTYWLCVLAINEHKALCGDCWTCRDKVLHRRLKPEEIRERCCEHGPKRNPCKCGTLKFARNDPYREVDKIATIIGKFAEKILVSLDPNLETLERVWVVKEIGEAVEAKHIVFRCIADLSERVMEKLEQGVAVVPPVAECEVTDKKEKAPVLKKIDASEGGQPSFNAFVRCMVELSFGVFRQLPQVTGVAERALRRMRQLEMHCSWSYKITSASKLGMDVSWEKMKNLQHMRLDFSSCRQLADVSSIGQGLKEMKSLQHMELVFSWCDQLADVSSIGQGLKEMKNLQHMKLDFSVCDQLADVSCIGQGLREMKSLQHMELDLSGCSQLADVSSIGQGLKDMKNLQHMKLNFSVCSQLADVSSIGQGLREMKSLQHMELDFSHCYQLADVSSIGQGLREMKSLLHMELDFSRCSQLADVSSIGQGLKDMKSLLHMKLNFSGCKQLANVSSIVQGLKEMKNLQHMEFRFSDCYQLADVTDVYSIRQSLKDMKNLKNLRVFGLEGELSTCMSPESDSEAGNESEFVSSAMSTCS